MHRSLLVFTFPGLALPACTSTIDRRGMRSELQAHSIVFTDQTVEQIAALEPQVRTPFHLAVATPIGAERPWSADEITEIEAWGAELERQGIISELTVIPSIATLAPGSASPLDQEAPDRMTSLRTAAARVHADAVLITRVVSDSSMWVDPLSILDLTIVGCWFIPGHHAESVTMIEGMLVDVANEYVYGVGSAEGRAKEHKPAVYLRPEEIDDAARLAALRGLGKVVLAKAKKAASEANATTAR
jgi:hypothetical protein